MEDINKILFSTECGEKKLEIIKKLSARDIRKTSPATILRIYNECKNKSDRFSINPSRRVGNDWNSTIEFVYEYKGRPYLCLYVQSSSSDSSDTTSYTEFNKGNEFKGYCYNLDKSYTYDANDIARTIRCILMEYVYHKDIEKGKIDKDSIKAKLMNYKIVNPIYDYFYKRLRLENLPFSYMQSTRNGKAYYKGKDALHDYIDVHCMELKDKTQDELKTIYTEVFEKAINC